MKTDTKDDLPQEGNNLPAVGSTKAVAPLSPLQLYLKEVARYPLLKPEEELELAQKHFEEEDIHAAHRLITANLRLVVKIANDFKKAQVNFLDLIQEGNYGLMQAVKRFNPYKGVKLSSYSAWWIRALSRVIPYFSPSSLRVLGFSANIRAWKISRSLPFKVAANSSR